MSRRLFLQTLVAMSLACKRRTPAPSIAASSAAPNSAPAPPAIDDVREGLEVRDWDMEVEHGGPKRCTVLVPRLPKGVKVPLLVALHGMGETTSPEKGSRGWLDSYGLDRAIALLRRPPLAASAFKGLVSDTRLAQVNAELQDQPYSGLVVACPYLPREIGVEFSYELYARWLSERLIPKLYAETPVFGTAATTGIDGVSLGGRTALRVGLPHPELFGAIGTLQPAVNDVEAAEAMADLIASKLGDRPLHLVTSTEDSYRFTVAALHEKLLSRKIAHDYLLTEGPHDYVWNQGPGGIEMLLWHDRVLRS